MLESATSQRPNNAITVLADVGMNCSTFTILLGHGDTGYINRRTCASNAQCGYSLTLTQLQIKALIAIEALMKNSPTVDQVNDMITTTMPLLHNFIALRELRKIDVNRLTAFAITPTGNPAYTHVT